MVVVLHLEDSDMEPHDPSCARPKLGSLALASDPAGAKREAGPASPRTDPEAAHEGSCSGLIAILACYPVAVQLAAYIDRNTLHELSRTSRGVHAALLQFGSQLRAHTLQCSNDVTAEQHALASVVSGDRSDVTNFVDVVTGEISSAARATSSAYTGYQSWEVQGGYGMATQRITSCKIGPCTRDLVSECRRCGRVVCRNCITKPSAVQLHRYRRLCVACTRAPLVNLTGVPTVVDAALAPLVRAACSCTEMFFICQPCGHAIHSADINYRRNWIWRTSYGARQYGLGTGIGEGDQGVPCGRGLHCCAARSVEVEVDGREAEVVAAMAAAEATETLLNNIPVHGNDVNGHGGSIKAGYLRQEVEGIGGVLRTKFKKRVRIPLPVDEHEDERTSMAYLQREQDGEVRSWCGWCDRAIPSQREMAAALGKDKE